MNTTNVLHTDVDSFIELVKKKKKLTINEAAKELNVPLETVQAWTDFLVEEKILGVEYKFTTQYIYYNFDPDENLNMSFTGFDTKEAFYEKARKKGLADSQIKLLWIKYISLNKASMRNLFFEKAREKQIPEEKIPVLWKRYLAHLES